MYVTLIPRPFSEENPVGGYILRVTDDDNGVISEIVIDVSRKSGGMSIEKWKHSTRKKDANKRVIGVYFWVSMMGHELDQWRYYDLDARKDVT